MSSFKLSDLWAYGGGVLLTISLVPELELVWRQRNTSDLSYKWIALYISGLTLTLIYMVEIDAFAGWITILFELILAVSLLFSKIYLENFTDSFQGKIHTNDSQEHISSFRASNNSIFHDILGSSSHSHRSQGHSRQDPANATELSLVDRSDHGINYLSGEYKGFHVYLDYTNVYSAKSAELGEFMMETMTSALLDHNIRIVHKHIEVFPEESMVSPPGFASVVLIDESHVSAHSYSELGMLAIDVFTCGSRPDITAKVASQIHQTVLNKFPNAKYRHSHARRFPKSILPTNNNSQVISPESLSFVEEMKG